MKLTTLLENDEIIAVNKPAGMLTIPHRIDQEQLSVVQLLKRQFPELFTIHRIDRDTSGVLIFAKNAAAHRHYSMLFQDRKVKKIYEAICLGNPAISEGVIENYLMEHPTLKGKYIINKKGKYAHSEYKTIQQWKHYTHYEVEIFTGRTHQIRVHLANLGTPIIADNIYGNDKPLFLSDFKKKFNLSTKDEEEKPIMSRLALHSRTLEVTALSGEPLIITSPLPKDFTATISQLNKWCK